MTKETDYIIVGGGSAGCVIANRLSADADTSVALLDAGRKDNHLYTRVPAGQMGAFTRPDMNWLFTAQPDPSINHREQWWPAGRVLGGGSSINGMMFVRGHAGDYDDWAANGCTGWSYREVLPYFKRLERNEAGADEWRGDSGPLSVSSVRIDHPLTDAFVASAEAIGIRRNHDLNGKEAEGVGYCQASQRNGWRHSTAQAFIRPIKHRPNLQVEHHATVTRILLENGQAVGVEYSQRGHTRRLHARRGVILSAGAMVSPKLLMLSGIGDPEQLAAHGIETKLSMPSVGKNLQEHAVGRVEVRFAGMGTITSDLNLFTAVRHGIDYLLRGRGALATCIGHAMALVRTSPAVTRPDAQIIFAPLDFTLTEKGARPSFEPTVTFGIGLCHAHSRGEIRLRSGDPFDAPIIDYPLLGDARDMATLIAASRLTRQLIAADPIARYVEAELMPGEQVQSDADWETYLRETAGLMYHPCGTCRMGSDSASVVDPSLKVRGIHRLWVADASVIPEIPAGNINATCIMIGEKAADLIAGNVVCESSVK